jgi:hypothetical protein
MNGSNTRKFAKIIIGLVLVFVFVSSCFVKSKFDNPTDGVGGFLLEGLSLVSIAGSIPKISISNYSKYITEGSSTSISVKLIGNINKNYEIKLKSSNNEIISLSESSILFTTLNYNIEKNITITAKIDTNLINENISILLESEDLEKVELLYEISERTLTINIDGALEIDEYYFPSSYNLTLSENPGTIINIKFTTDSNFILISKGSQLTFDQNNWNISQLLTLNGFADNNSLDDEISLNISGQNLKNSFKKLIVKDTFYTLPIKKTKIISCYDNTLLINCANINFPNQDADIQSGLTESFSGPIQSSNFSSDYTTRDLVSGLVWKTCSEGLSGNNCQTGSPLFYNYEDAKLACKRLNLTNSGQGYSGIKTWRLPYIFELESIVDYSRSTSPAINQSYFPRTFSNSYWSYNIHTLDDRTAWLLSFTNGGSLVNDKILNYYVRCVSK